MEDKYDVFISYRRKGGFETARMLYDRLIRDGYRVSFDIDTLRNGDFNKELYHRIDECTDFIVVLNEGAFDRTLDPDFNPAKDWLRNELARALAMNKNVIPVLLAGFDEFPENLPPDIADVEKMAGPKCSQYYFDAFYEDLKKRLNTKPDNAETLSEAMLSLEEDVDIKKAENTSMVYAFVVIVGGILLAILFANALNWIFGISTAAMWIYGILSAIFIIGGLMMARDSMMNKRMMSNFKNKKYDKAYDQAIAIVGDDDANDNSNARLILGMIFYNGLGKEVNYPRALYWFKKAGDENTSALYHIGLIYLNGQGVRKDKQLAAIYFKKAATLGDPLAQKELQRL